jgi:hypothetical protein
MKKLIRSAAVLVFIALAGFVNGAKAQESCMATGDINGDGIVLSVGDLVVAIRILGCEGAVPDSMYRMDLNGDCQVNQYDLEWYNLVQQYGLSVLPGYPRATCCNPTVTFMPPAARGDVNRDGSLTSADVVLILSCVFTATGPNCSFCQTDVNCDFARTPADVVAELNYVVLGQASPGCP